MLDTHNTIAVNNTHTALNNSLTAETETLKPCKQYPCSNAPPTTTCSPDACEVPHTKGNATRTSICSHKNTNMIISPLAHFYKRFILHTLIKRRYKADANGLRRAGLGLKENHI